MNWETLRTFGYEGAAEPAPSENERLFPARVVEQQKDGYRIISPAGLLPARVSGKFSFTAQRTTDFPAVGDWVLVDIANDSAIIRRVMPRRGALERKSAGLTSASQIIAANLDGIFLCMSVNENFNLRRLERYLAVAWSSGAVPCVILTKSDLTDDCARVLEQTQNVAIGTEVITATDADPHGFDEVRKRMSPGKTYAFIGSSGVGKSTIVNHLLGETVLAVSEVDGAGKGRHTTTARQMFVTPEGAIVIDTPGMRELQLDSADFSAAFSDVEALAASCRFSDCSHHHEPGCAVIAAAESGLLPEERLRNYRKMQREIAYQEQRSQDAARRESRGRKRF